MKAFIISLAIFASISTNIQAQTKVPKKLLVTYFSVPEKDDIDTSTGASRIISDGKLLGATEYVAKIIADATGADLFQIKTVHTYPPAHKALIDYAKKEADTKTYPKMTSKINNFADYDVVFVVEQSRKGLENWLQKQGFIKQQNK